MPTDIKPCPFCGAKGRVAYQSGCGVWGWFAGCDGPLGPLCPGYIWKATPVYINQDLAAEYWNRRANHEQGAVDGEDHANTAGD